MANRTAFYPKQIKIEGNNDFKQIDCSISNNRRAYNKMEIEGKVTYLGIGEYKGQRELEKTLKHIFIKN